MPRKLLETRNAQFKKAASLYKRANRFRFARCVVEGPQAVRELLLFSSAAVRDVYVTERALLAHRDVAELIDRYDPFTHILPPALFARLSQDAQEILAVADVPDEVSPKRMFSSSRLVVFALRMSDPGNLGTLIRTADACGADGVITGENSAEATNPKVIRSSTGSVFHLPVTEHEDAAQTVRCAKEAGFQILAADHGGSLDLGDLLRDALCGAAGRADSFSAAPPVDLVRPTLWMFGNEAHGFTADELSLADAIVSVPMWGNAESLNVATAAAVCLYSSAMAQNTAKP
ncbi:RNA methyltransferase [Arcanobacterium sp. S3PF19]|uniref:TrmH family RNA methyltransferase n=1 Tax=Arcanobacterium sp. S3PF19 TaxID=1219585 RepID=UPI00054D163F|nr:RNA methyltransferase [Arcanobacterium sp. S3PF19]